MHRKTALQLTTAFKKGKISATEIVTLFLKRIQKHDPELKAFLTILEERAYAQAKVLDEKRTSGKPLGLLAGVPVAIKDNLNIKGTITSCASQFLTNYKALFNATAIDLLEKEDALILGKTNLDEFAMGSSTENSSFFPTKNPWDLSLSPGGSSGGSAAAVTAGLSLLSLGSDTGGSIRQPASFCGIVGVKPTYGRVSRYGLVAFGSSLDQIGPFSRTVEDAALATYVLGKPCARDSTSFPHEPEPFHEKLNEKRDLTIGVPWALLEALPVKTKSAFLEAMEKFKSLGMKVVDINLDLVDYSVAIYYIVATAEASTNLARFDGIRYGKRSERAKTLDEVYEFSKEEGFGPEVKKRILLGTYVLSSGYQDAFYRKARKVRTLMKEQFKACFKSCDIIATPTAPNGAFALKSISDPLQMYLQDIYTIPANLVGVPALSLPMGLDNEGKPLGLQLMAPSFQELTLFQAAHAFEKVSTPIFPRGYYE